MRKISNTLAAYAKEAKELAFSTDRSWASKLANHYCSARLTSQHVTFFFGSQVKLQQTRKLLTKHKMHHHNT
jgi:hypothetical protein